LTSILGDDRCAICGGVAVSAHGFVRATRDVDVIVSLSLEEARQKLRRAGIAVRTSKGDPLEGEFRSLKGELGGVPFDILPDLVPLEPERTVEVTVGGHRLRVVDLETLVRLKLKAGGPGDLHDIAVLVQLQPGYTARALALAAPTPRLAEMLKVMIEDPRVRYKAQDLQEHERVLRARRGRRMADGKRR